MVHFWVQGKALAKCVFKIDESMFLVMVWYKVSYRLLFGRYRGRQDYGPPEELEIAKITYYFAVLFAIK